MQADERGWLTGPFPSRSLLSTLSFFSYKKSPLLISYFTHSNKWHILKEKRVRVEEATFDDAQEILDVINSSNREAFGQIIPKEYFREPIITREGFDECLNKMTFYVHRQEDVVVAVAALSIEDEDIGRIRWVYVLPKFQKQGIGTALILHLERVARERGLRKTRLVTDNNAEWAITFYKKLGYTLTSKVPNPWGFDVWMDKRL